MNKNYPSVVQVVKWNHPLAHLHFSSSRCKGDWISGLARPGSKGIARKNHEVRLASWIGRALYLAWYRAGRPFSFREQGYSDVGAPGRAPERPAPFFGSRAGSPGRIPSPPMLFPRNALASGLQACFEAEKGLLKGGQGIIPKNAGSIPRKQRYRTFIN